MSFLPYSQINNGISPAFSYYNQLEFTPATPTVTLVFPGSFLPSFNYFSAYLKLVQNNAAAGQVILPDPILGAPGNSGIFYNTSAFNINIMQSNGSQLLEIKPGEVWVVVLNGSLGWDTFQIGGIASEVDAAALAGAGLFAGNSKLNVYLNVQNKNAAFTIDETLRGTLISWTGGTTTQTLPLASTFSNGYFFYIKNASFISNGLLTLSPTAPNTIDNKSNLILSLNQSCILYTDGLNWFTEGLGFLSSDLGVKITANGIQVIPGTAADPSYSFTTAPNTGFYLNSPNIAVSIAGTNTMTFGQGIDFSVAGSRFITIGSEPYIYLKDMLGV